MTLDTAPQTITGGSTAGAAARATRAHIVAVATVPRVLLADALAMLATHEGSSHSAHVRMWSGALEITRQDAPSAYWETAVVPATGWRGDADASGSVDVGALTHRVDATDAETLQVHLLSDGRLVLAATELAAAEAVPAPPRPSTVASVLPVRVTLPKLAIQHIALRLPGPHLWVPDAVAQSFSSRRVTMGSLFQLDSGWYLSGVVDGRPMLVLTGAVGVY